MRKDGTLVFTEDHPDTAGDIWSLRPGAKPEKWVATSKQENSPKFSPDGQLIAYSSDESERFEIYVSPSISRASETRYPRKVGGVPCGRRRVTGCFIGRERKSWPSTSSPMGVLPELHRLLFDEGWSLGTFSGLPIAPTRRVESDFAVLSNGDLLMIKAEPEAIPTKLRVIFNFFEELNRLCPTK